MNCDGVRGLLSAYLDGELTPGELLRVEQHLLRCPACADEVDRLRQTIALVASLDEIEVPASFHTQLHERLVAAQPPALQEGGRRAAGKRQRRIFRWVIPAAAAAAFAIAFSALPQVRGMLGLETPAGLVASPGDQSGSGTTGTATITGTASGAGEKGGKSGPVNSASGSEVQDSSGGRDVASLDLGGASTVSESGGSRPATVTITGGTSGDARAATQGSGTGEVPADWESMYSYSITLSVSGVSQDQIVSALRDFNPRAESDSILTTVPASQRSVVVAAVRAVPGAQLSAEPAETAVDLGPQIYDLTSRLEADQQQLQSLKEQMASMDDEASLEDARLLQKALEERISETSEALDRLKGQVDTALITVRMESGG